MRASNKCASLCLPHHVFVNPEVAVDSAPGYDEAFAERHQCFQSGRVRHLRVQGLLELQERGGVRRVEHQDQGPATLKADLGLWIDLFLVWLD